MCGLGRLFSDLEAINWHFRAVLELKIRYLGEKLCKNRLFVDHIQQI